MPRRKKPNDYGTGIPYHEVEALARVLLPEIQAFFESEDGQREYAEWKAKQLFLEDSDWTSANTYCEAILDVDPENADAYLGKLLAELQIQKKELLPNCVKPFDDSGNYQKCIRFADTSLANEIKGYLQQVKEQSEHSRMDDIYQQGVSAMSSAKDISGYKAAIQQFKQIPDYNDANKKINYCYEQIISWYMTIREYQQH